MDVMPSLESMVEEWCKQTVKKTSLGKSKMIFRDHLYS